MFFARTPSSHDFPGRFAPHNCVFRHNVTIFSKSTVNNVFCYIWSGLSQISRSSSFMELVDLNWCRLPLFPAGYVKLFHGACGSKSSIITLLSIMILSSSFMELVDLNYIYELEKELSEVKLFHRACGSKSSIIICIQHLLTTSSSFMELVDLNLLRLTRYHLQAVKLFHGACGSKSAYHAV